MSDALYSKAVLRLAADAHGAGRLPRPDATGTAHNPTCGDKVVFDLTVRNGRIEDVSQDAKACVLTQASASILGQRLKGATRENIEALRRSVDAMLEQRESAPPPPFEAYGVFDGVLEFPARHRCVLLPIEAVLAALESLEASQPEPVRREP